jgi:hypothetical protein
MDGQSVIDFPRSAEQFDEDQEAALGEIDAAIALVLSRVARRIRLSGMAHAVVVAGAGAAHAQSAGVAFGLDRDDDAGSLTITVGPIV